MAGPRRIRIIHNPVAGGGRARRLTAIVKALVAQGCRVEVTHTRMAGHASELAQAAAGNADVVVAAGGDGTLSEVAAGLVGTDQTMGLIPVGTANVAAIDLGFYGPLGVDWNRVVQALVKGTVKPLAVGRITTTAGTRTFVLVVGVGLDGEAVHHVDTGLKKLMGQFAYVVSGLQIWWSHKAVDLVVKCGDDGQWAGNWVIFTNGRHYGSRFTLAPDADMFDPRLHAVIMRPASRARLAGLAGLFAVGALRPGHDVTMAVGQAFSVDAIGGQPVPIQVDGDVFGTTPATVEIVSNSIPFLIYNRHIV